MRKAISTVALLTLLAGCATYPGAAPNAPDRAKLASIELKSSMDQAYIVDDFEKHLKVRDHFTPNAAMDAAAMATDGGVSAFLLSLSLMSGDDAQSVVSKYAFPENVAGHELRTAAQVDNLVSDFTISAAQQNAFELLQKSADNKVMLFKAAGTDTLYLRVYNFGGRKLDKVAPHLEFAWGFSPSWIARQPASYNICWGTDLATKDDGTFETTEASDGRQLPAVDCDRSIPESVVQTLKDLTATGYFVYANTSVRVNRLFFEGVGYNPVW